MLKENLVMQKEKKIQTEKYFLLWYNLVTKPSPLTWLDNSCWSSSLTRCSNPAAAVVVAVARRCWGQPTACPALRDSESQTRLASYCCCCWSALCPPHWGWNSETTQSHDVALKALSHLSKVFTVWSLMKILWCHYERITLKCSSRQIDVIKIFESLPRAPVLGPDLRLVTEGQ